MGSRGTFPTSDRSPFRETALVVLGSAGTHVFSGLVFGVLRSTFPERTPDIGGFIRDPGAFFQAHYLSVSVWGLGSLVIACVLAAIVARWGPELSGPVNSRSAWYLAFEDKRARGRGVHVGCELKDGSYLAGPLRRFSTEPEETGDRELTLEAPITYVAHGGTQVDLKVNMAVVSAREIKFLTVSFVPLDR